MRRDLLFKSADHFFLGGAFLFELDDSIAGGVEAFDVGDLLVAIALDLRARHLAGFEWPRAHASENAVVEPFVREEVALDLVRTGRPALRPLGAALKEAAPTEAAAMRIVAAMIRIGGRAAAEEFASLIDDPRVGVAAATALLYLGRQEMLLRTAASGRVEAARSLLTMVGDIMDYSRLEAAQVHFRAEPVKLSEFLRATLAQLEPQARAKALGLLD